MSTQKDRLDALWDKVTKIEAAVTTLAHAVAGLIKDNAEGEDDES